MDGQITEIKFAGKTIPLKSEKLRAVFLKIRQQQETIEKLSSDVLARKEQVGKFAKVTN